MKYKVLSIGERVPASFLNIGDYIQGVASAQFLPTVDGFIDREEVGKYAGEECKVIMNGWFKHFQDGWPPSEKIKPLFLSFHINSTAKEWMLSDKSIAYLKKYEPIGCRDHSTRDLLIARGVKAYFSGCMTLTLGEKYKSKEKDNQIYFVDPYYSFSKKPIKVLKNLWNLIIHYKKIKHVASKFDCCWWCKSYKKLFITSYFYNQYRQVFSDEILLNAKYICQENAKYKDDFHSPQELFNEAERLIKLYARAKFIVTSRIHCALPCLGLETPVIYVENKQQQETSACRLDGLRQLFNVIDFSKEKLSVKFSSSLPITSYFIFTNKETWRTLTPHLKKRCRTFVEA